MLKSFLISTSVLLLQAPSPAMHASGGLPQANVCPEMEKTGEDMLRGDPHGFYFVDAMQGTFPIPRFFVVSGVEGSGDIRLTGWALPYEEHEELESMDIHAHSNVCDWSMTISYGPVENVSSIIEGNSGGHEQIADYSTPGLRVIHVRLHDVDSVSTVIAYDEERHISFTQRDADKALWLLRLYEELSVGP